jgi:hypothetical protein
MTSRAGDYHDEADDDDGPVQVDGCIVHTSEQLTAWTKKNMTDLTENGQMFNKPHYTEALTALRDPTKRVVVGIIPSWHGPRVGELMDKFFAHENYKVSVRRLFAGIELLIGETKIPDR